MAPPKKKLQKKFVTRADQLFYRIDRETKLKDQGGVCFYCKTPLTIKTATTDHVHPLSRIGGNYHSTHNTVACCLRCNQEKKDRPPEEFANDPVRLMAMRIERRIRKAEWSLDVETRLSFNKWLKFQEKRLKDVSN
jgi:hypothetical protein